MELSDALKEVIPATVQPMIRSEQASLQTKGWNDDR